MCIYLRKKRIGNHHTNAESEIGNSGRIFGSRSLLQGGRGCESVVLELFVATSGLDGSKIKVVIVLSLDGPSLIVIELLVNSSNVLLAA